MNDSKEIIDTTKPLLLPEKVQVPVPTRNQTVKKLISSLTAKPWKILSCSKATQEWLILDLLDTLKVKLPKRCCLIDNLVVSQ